MKIPQLKRKLEVKKYHDFELKDEFSWIHQKDILNVLKDSSKLNPEIRKYLEDENDYTKFKMKDTEQLQKKLFNEIKAANTHGTDSGKWSARKAQLLAKKYKALGGGYY